MAGSIGDEFNELPDAVFGVVARDVGLAQHADKVVPVDNGQPADLMLLHGFDRFLDGVIGTDRDGFALAEFACGGRAVSSGGGA
jgi:hypothetical protein